MYSTSTNYKNKILADSTRQLLNIYIDNNKIEDRYVLECKINYTLLNNDEFCFGSTPAKTVNIKIHKNGLPETYNRFYIESGIAGEIVPIGYFNVEAISKDDDYTVSITLIDDMPRFEFNYDGSVLDYPVTVLTVLQDICSKAGVELGSTSFFNFDKQVAVYDSTVTARTYLGYIAEQAGGFAIIGRDGKLYIRTIGEDISELNLKYFSEYSWGEKFKVSRIAYEDGIQNFKKGNETNNTIWISPDNMYIVDQEQIDNIYNQYQDFEVYSFSGTSIIDPAWDIGDIITIDNKKIIYQGEQEYKGKFKASISSNIQAKSKEDTTVSKISDSTKIRRVQSKIDQEAGRITQLIQETTENSTKLAEQEISVNGIKSEVFSTNAKVEKLENSKVDSTDYNQMIETLKTLIEQGDSQIEFNFQQIIDKTDELGNIIANSQSVLEEYIRFKGALIELGRVGNDFSAELSNTELAFLQNGQKIAYISNNKLYIIDAEVQNQLVIGKFAFIPRANGNLSFTWIGG